MACPAPLVDLGNGLDDLGPFLSHSNGDKEANKKQKREQRYNTQLCSSQSLEASLFLGVLILTRFIQMSLVEEVAQVFIDYSLTCIMWH